MKFAEAIELFLEYLKNVDRSPKTIEGYHYRLGCFDNYLCIKYNRPVLVDEVTADDFERFLFEAPNDKNFSQTTRSTFTTAFKSFYSFCYNKGYCMTNLGKQVMRIKAKTKERGFITEDELLKMIAVMDNETDKAIMQTMFYAGLRISEAIGLTYEDINLEDNYINVRRLKSRFDRKIPISIKLGLILEEYLENVRNGIEIESNKVFIFENGRKYSEKHFNRMIKTAATKAGLNTNISSHIMRHSFASNLIAKGVDIVKIRKLLGHESINTTNIYLHTNMQLLKKAIDTL